MKITDRISKIEGISHCIFNFEECKLSIFLEEPKNHEHIKAMVIKTISDLQLQDSVKNFDFFDFSKDDQEHTQGEG